ncbi:hypothetical protein GCM10027075_58980 [Streptomyces heilongjiangensis]
MPVAGGARARVGEAQQPHGRPGLRAGHERRDIRYEGRHRDSNASDGWDPIRTPARLAPGYPRDPVPSPSRT